MAIDYYNKIKSSFLIKLVQRAVADRTKCIFDVAQVWPDSSDPNIELLRFYIWVLTHPLSHLQLAGIASRTLPISNIQKL